ncbi:hypothetical protein BKA70DRAFT_1325071 [Coprinopsis sp. MPI-PUGE-AT-0042]|nr:hypothetical protein BKA70DRAFT_1325071 [Coprinopsis sp. MPI-PUGE-AT-0042]
MTDIFPHNQYHNQESIQALPRVTESKPRIRVDRQTLRRGASLSAFINDYNLGPHGAQSTPSTSSLRGYTLISSPVSPSHHKESRTTAAEVLRYRSGSHALLPPFKCPPLLRSSSPYGCIGLPPLHNDNVQLNPILLMSSSLIRWDIRTPPSSASLIRFHPSLRGVDWRLTPATTPSASSLAIRCGRFDKPIVVFPSAAGIGVSVFDILSAVYAAECWNSSTAPAMQGSVFVPGSALGRLDFDPSTRAMVVDPVMGNEALRMRPGNPNHGRDLQATVVGGWNWAGLMHSVEEVDVWILVLNEGRPSVLL